MSNTGPVRKSSSALDCLRGAAIDTEKASAALCSRTAIKRGLQHGQTTVQGRHQTRHSRLEAGLGTLHLAERTEGGTERPDRAVRRHGPCRVVAVWRRDQHADAAEA